MTNTLSEQIAIEQASLQPTLEERRVALSDCMAKLSPDDQALIHQRYMTEDTVAQLAISLNQPADTLYKRLSRIRGRLLRCINRAVTPDGGVE